MRSIFVRVLFIVIAATATSTAVSAGITSISSDLCSNPECVPATVQPIVRGKTSSMTIKGPSVDLATGVDPVAGVTPMLGARTHGTGSSIVIHFVVRPDAQLGERIITLKYLIGSDTFRIRVIRGGTITSLQRVLNGVEVAPINMPVNVPVTLRFKGISIGNADIARNFDIGAKAGGCEESETVCNFNVTFTRVGAYVVNLIDNILPNQTTSSLSKFHYAGPDDITVVGQAAAPTYPISGPRVLSGVATPSVSIDAAPRSSMFNLVRRISTTSPNFTRDGFAYYRLASPENLCQGMTGTQSRRITVANPNWGVTNTGGNLITSAFQAQLRVGTQVVDTGGVPANLAAGSSVNFEYDRPGDSLLSVFTFLDQLGCFVSPTAVAFFEDPLYTVVVDTTAPLLAESNETNNSRTF